MATIAPPRFPAPRRGVTSIDVTTNQPYNYVKRTAVSMNKYSAKPSNLFPRQHRIEISTVSVLQNGDNDQGCQNLQQIIVAKQSQPLVAISNNKMASPSSNKQSPPPSSSTFFTSSPVTPRKHVRDKSLPPKPSLRSQDSPERRSVLDATDLTASSLDGIYPPLEPTSSPESINSTEESAEHSRVKITPSLLSKDQSPTSPASFTEYGIAHSISIEAFNKPPKVQNKQHHDAIIPNSLEKMGQTSPENNVRSDPADGSTTVVPLGRLKQPSHHHVGNQLFGNPSKYPQNLAQRSYNDNRSTYCEKNTSSRFKRDTTPKLISRAKTGLKKIEKESTASDVLLSGAVTCNNSNVKQNDGTNEALLCGKKKRDSQRSSKYGYHIKESFDAHEIIMGKQGDTQTGKTIGEQSSTHSCSPRLSRHVSIRELKIRLTTPPPKKKFSMKDSNSKSVENLLGSSEDNCNSTEKILPIVHNEIGKKSDFNASGNKSPLYTSPHPPRTSSLQGTPPAKNLRGAKVSNSTSIRNISKKPASHMVTGLISVNGNSFKVAASQYSPPSMLYRDTAASAARASLSGKKAANSRASTSRLPHSRTLSSFGDVGKGMKILGKKMGKIIPGLRNASPSINLKEKFDTESESNNSTAHLIPQRQASRLLTTYENSGMNKTTDEDLCVFHGDIGGYGKLESTDKHETEQTTQDKEAWQPASYGLVRSSGAMRFFGQSPTRANIPFGDSDSDEDPSNPQQAHPGMPGHYIEVELMPTDESLLDSERVTFLGTPTRTEYDFSEENAAQDLIPHADEEAASPDTIIPEVNTNRSNVQDFLQEGCHSVDENQNFVPEASENADYVQNTTSHAPGTMNGFQDLVSEMHGGTDLNEAEARVRELLDWALSLEDSALQNLVIAVCDGLAQSILQIRNARMSFIQAGLAADELICFIENSIIRLEASVVARSQ